MMTDGVFFQGVARKPRLREKTLGHGASADCEALTRDAEDFFCALFRITGLPLEAYRPRYLRRRLPACLRALRAADACSGIDKLSVHPDKAARALGAVLIGVTEFCRDTPVFRHLREALLPLWKACPTPRRIWSAACSDGQELYSVAMLLAEAGLIDATEMLGTDFRPEAIADAVRGRFRPETVGPLNAMDPSWRQQWFEPGTHRLHVAENLRRHIQWRRCDLFLGAERGPWHLILWRNMAIYLEPQAAHPIWRRLVAELAPGGWLITGKADYPPLDLDLVRIAPCIFQKPNPAAS
jgi:chemotaxis methyl-accepting protein methylase